MGHNPIVFEARSETVLESEGVFLTLAPNGMNGLRTIGCFEEVKASGIDTIGIEIRNARAKRLGFAGQADHPAEFGAPSLTICRGRLTEILLAKTRTVGVDLWFDAPVSSVAALASGVRLQLRDGASHDASILVAANGLGSKVPGIPEATLH